MSQPDSTTDYLNCFVCQNGQFGIFCSRECEDHYWLEFISTLKEGTEDGQHTGS